MGAEPEDATRDHYNPEMLLAGDVGGTKQRFDPGGGRRRRRREGRPKLDPLSLPAQPRVESVERLARRDVERLERQRLGLVPGRFVEPA